MFLDCMPKKDDGEDGIISETGNWNVADDFSRSKIMRPLIMADYYEDIALFGYESIAEELIGYTAPSNDLVRIKALKRLIKTLIRVIDNSKFALKKAGTKEKILGYRANLVAIEKCIPLLIKITYDQIKDERAVVISNPQLFDEFLEKVSLIKSTINEPLNKNHLIFTDKEEFDPKAFKEKIKDRILNHG